jgi:hypothetical protein
MLDQKHRQEEAERFAHVYASTMVLAELYRNEPDKYFEARDSILADHDIDIAWMDRFRRSFEGREEKWAWVFVRIDNITDSLIEYFKEHPVDRDTTAATVPSEVTDSL